MTTTINFKIQGNHEYHSGTALVAPVITGGILAASQHFDFNPGIKRNVIGIIEHEGINYKIFENYVDSGSNDYFYFAYEIIE